MGVAAESDLGRVNGHGGFDVAAISDMLGPKVDRHGDGGHKHVHHIADDAPHHQRINGGRH